MVVIEDLEDDIPVNISNAPHQQTALKAEAKELKGTIDGLKAKAFFLRENGKTAEAEKLEAQAEEIRTSLSQGFQEKASSGKASSGMGSGGKASSGAAKAKPGPGTAEEREQLAAEHEADAVLGTPIPLAIATAGHGFLVMLVSTFCAIADSWVVKAEGESLLQGVKNALWSAWPWMLHGIIVFFCALGFALCLMSGKRFVTRGGGFVSFLFMVGLMVSYGKQAWAGKAFGWGVFFLYFFLFLITLIVAFANWKLLPLIKFEHDYRLDGMPEGSKEEAAKAAKRKEIEANVAAAQKARQKKA